MLAVDKCSTFMFRPVEVVEKSQRIITESAVKSGLEFAAEFFEARVLLQYTHALFLASYHQQC